MESQHSEQRPEAGQTPDRCLIDLLGEKIRHQNQQLKRLTEAVKSLDGDCKARLAAYLQQQELSDGETQAKTH